MNLDNENPQGKCLKKRQKKLQHDDKFEEENVEMSTSGQDEESIATRKIIKAKRNLDKKQKLLDENGNPIQLQDSSDSDRDDYIDENVVQHEDQDDWEDMDSDGNVEGAHSKFKNIEFN